LSVAQWVARPGRTLGNNREVVMPPSVRRVVTGVGESGRSRVISDEPVALGRSLAKALWGSDGPVVLRRDGTPDFDGFFPPAGGVRVTFFSRPEEPPAPPSADRTFHGVEVDPAGWHGHDTVDVIVVVSGELLLELEEGDPVLLRVGDVLVQNGVRHRWRDHPSPAPVLACGISFGASSESC
jgi:hypothetical protein